MTRGRRARSRHTGLVILILFILVILGIEAALVITAFVSPTASETLSEKVAGIREDWEGTEDEPGIPDRIGDSLGRFYRDQIVTLWSMPDPKPTSPTFAECGQCHAGFEDRARFEHVYIDHRLHAQEGMECAGCHTSVEHPRPDRPAEATCAVCHDQVNEKNGCDFCHPAGTLPHFFLLGAPRDSYTECATCHPSSTLPRLGKRLVHVGEFSGDPDDKCLQCHGKSKDVETIEGATLEPRGCGSCHGERHPKDWMRTHPDAALSGIVCTQCHASTWCAMACHATTPMFRPPLIPLPSPSEVITP